ncbi:MAG: hypothetical protein Q4F11_09785 [Eubacteriales bacterium]|nr:hypothetical protein [Eubacteriales bacterium]
MVYFQAKKKRYINIKVFISVIAFIVIIMLCVYGSDSILKQNLSIQQHTLENALHNSTIQYYALNGYYPDNLNELLSSSVISYNKSKFYIDYQPVASNIMPEITVIERK